MRGLPETLFDDAHRALYADYMRELDIPERMFLPLGLIHWAQLVNHHYGVHRCRWDASWRNQNLAAPLERWEKLLKL